VNNGSMRTIAMIIIATVTFITCSVLALYAQKTNPPKFESGNPEFIALASRIDTLAQEVWEVRKADADIIRKLDQVLSNQEKILSELAIVKVRASMPR